MAASTPGAEAIPQYLQWKIESQRTDINLDKKLEEANKVLHNRILKMREGKLCTGCVLFVGRDHKSHWGFAGALWSRFEVVPGSTEEASLLAKKPRLNWNIIAGKSVTCTLCKAFLEAALPLLPEESNMVRPNQLSIDLHRGALTLPRMNSKTCKHRSHKANEWHGLTATFTWNGQSDDAVKYTIWPNSGSSQSNSNDTPHHCIWHRDVRPTVDFDLVAGWLKACDETHGHHPGSQGRGRALDGIRFIDLQQRCIVRRSRNVRYAALSYTWGSREQYCLTKKNMRMLEENGGLSSLEGKFRPVVTDAMQVCRRLDISYLWIDCLCIVQDDEASKHSQIQNMDLVYANAYITLVAASEQATDPHVVNQSTNEGIDEGLARVSVPVTTNRVNLPLNGMSYTCSADDINTLCSSFSGSLWFSRGWTFQELVCARRILVFTAKQAFLYCPEGLLTESFHHGEDQFKAFHVPPQRKDVSLCGSLNENFNRGSMLSISDIIAEYQDSYVPLVKAYMERNLSYDSDGLNAFSGIISAASRTLGPFHWGLPLKTIARALLLDLHGHDRPSDPPNRKLCFPSWSWLGWASGSVSDAFDDRYQLVPLVHI
ncbi:hypothetical protein HBH47_043270 [Parastagonospora nodorum]|nr:hypothetical protein HBH47_043270 [Parastagonospora nodorum]